VPLSQMHKQAEAFENASQEMPKKESFLLQSRCWLIRLVAILFESLWFDLILRWVQKNLLNGRQLKRIEFMAGEWVPVSVLASDNWSVRKSVGVALIFHFSIFHFPAMDMIWIWWIWLCQRYPYVGSVSAIKAVLLP